MKTLSQKENNATGPQHKIEGLPSDNRCNRGFVRFQQMMTISQKKQARTVGGATFPSLTVFAHREADK